MLEKFSYCMILLFFYGNLINDKKGKSSGICHILILTLLILILIETVTDLIHLVLQKSVSLSFVTQCDLKPFVIRQSINEKSFAVLDSAF